MKDSSRNASPETFVDKMDRAATVAADNRREDPRWRFRKINVPICVEHPGGGVRKIFVSCRNISTGGLSFIHKGFLHPGTACVVVLTKRDNHAMAVNGSVVNCRYVSEGIHEVGVRFDQRIQIHHILNINDASTQAGASIELKDLRGRVLYVDENPMDQVLLNHHIRTSGIELTTVHSADEALAELDNVSFDIVITELALGAAKNSTDFIKAVRAKKFAGPIVLATGDGTGAKAAEAKAAGATNLLSKPYDPKQLYELLKTLHRKVGAVLTSKAIYSALDDQPAMEEALSNYVTYCNDAAANLDDLLRGENLEEIRALALNIKGTAEGFGFATVGDAAREALVQIDLATTVADARPALRTLGLLLNSVAVRRPGQK
jgi:CheY-like chemotaxis protein